MKNFEFSLESVWRIENQLDQLVDIRLASAKTALDRESEKLQALQQEFDRSQSEWREGHSNNPSQPVEGWAAFQSRMRFQMGEQSKQVQHHQTLLQEILREKIAGTQRLEGLKSLRNQEEELHRKEDQRRQQQQLLAHVLRAPTKG